MLCMRLTLVYILKHKSLYQSIYATCLLLKKNWKKIKIKIVLKQALYSTAK